jgi:peptidoglycan/xylan/chitin deacetylase (PgdA/CDA1 family)
MSEKPRRNIAPYSRLLNLDVLIRLAGRKVIFPFYHLASDRLLPHIRHIYPYPGTTDFESDLDAMLKVFEPVSLTDYLRKGDGSIKKARMVLSFDDGLAECYHHVIPILLRKGIPALFLLNNRFIDNREMFFRYKASLLIDRVLEDREALLKVAEFLVIPEEQVVRALLMVNFRQRALLDSLAPVAAIDFGHYLEKCPVYLTSSQVREMMDLGFEIGGHSDDHADFSILTRHEILEKITGSLKDLEERFGKSAARYFSFPFTTAGIPEVMIHEILDGGHALALLGTAGLKITGRKEYIQRIPMEPLGMPAMDTLKAEYLYYILKKPLGKNRI